MDTVIIIHRLFGIKLTASDGKKYNTDVISQAGVEKLAKAIQNQQTIDFLDWFTYSDNTIDGQRQSIRKKLRQNEFDTASHINNTQPDFVSFCEEVKS